MSTTSSRQVLLVPPALAVALLPAVVSWAASTQAPPSAPAVQFHQVLSGQNADGNVRVVLLGDRPLIAVDGLRPSNSATPALVLCADRACTRSRKVALDGPDAAARH